MATSHEWGLVPTLLLGIAERHRSEEALRTVAPGLLGRHLPAVDSLQWEKP